MTPCEEKGYKVGDKFFVASNGSDVATNRFKIGEMVELLIDDGTEYTKFKQCYGDLCQWVRICDVKPIANVEINQLAKQLRSAITKRDKQAAKAKRHTEKLEQREAEVQRLIGGLEREIEESTGLVCNIKEPLRGGIPDSSIPQGVITHGDIPDGVDVDDPSTWEEGDIIKCIRSVSEYFTEGREYEFNRIDPRDNSVEVKRDDEGDTFGSIVVEFRFVRRPS